MRLFYFPFLFLLSFLSLPALPGVRSCEELYSFLSNQPYERKLSETPLEWPKSITQSSLQLARVVENELLPMYRRAEHGYFRTRDNLKIAYSYFKASPEALLGNSPRATLLVSHGLGESRPQWLDQIKTFTKEGYDVFIYEHRGQAHSDRSLPNHHKVHVKRFSDYESDMHAFVEQMVKPRSSGPVYGVGFSLGGLVSTFNHIHHPEDFSALVAISPAYQIKTREFPPSLVKFIVDSMVFLGRESEYSFYQKDFTEEKLDLLRRHTHDSDRWIAFLKVLERYPMTVPGGLTHGWLSNMLDANQRVQREIRDLKKPTLVIEAEQDGLVDSRVLRKLTQNHPWISSYSDPKAFHSIIHDSDSIRNPAMTEILRFLVHPERLDSRDLHASAQRLSDQSDNFLQRNEPAFARYAAEEAVRRWSVDNPNHPLPAGISASLKRAKHLLSESSEGQKGLYEFLRYRRKQELEKIYPSSFLQYPNF